MDPPRTPSKTGDGFNDLARSLCVRWGLNLPFSNFDWSPSRKNGLDTTEEQVLRQLRMMYYRWTPQLDQALRRFDDHATYISSKWQYKPSADVDLLPFRAHADSPMRKESFLKTRDLPIVDSKELTKTLLRFLKEELESSRATARQRPYDQSPSDKRTALYPKIPLPDGQSRVEPISPRLQSTLSTKQTASDVEQSHSDEFNPPSSLANAMQDIPMEDVPALSAAARTWASVSPARNKPTVEQQQKDDTFYTPPSSPPQLNTSNNEPLIHSPSSTTCDTMDEMTVDQQLDLVPLSRALALNRKRSRPESVVLPVPRKVSRGVTERSLPIQYSVNHMVPDIQIASGSFGSIASMDSSTMTESTEDITPDTSFSIESARTSFGFSTQGNEEESVSRPRQDLHSFSNKVSNMHLSVSEHTKKVEPLYPVLESQLPSRSGRIAFTHVDQLVDYLTDNGPFSHLASQTCSPLSFRQTYETYRVALHCGFPMEDLSYCLKQCSDDYTLLWRSLASTAQKFNQPMPERSALAAWKKAGHGFEGVALTGELTLAKSTNGRAGPLFDFRLKPLKLETSCRFFRKFGSDRFCVIDMAISAVKDLANLLNLKKNDATFTRDAIKNWLVTVDHHFLGRVWRVFYLKEVGLNKSRKGTSGNPSEMKYRFYFFATDGCNFRSESTSNATKQTNEAKDAHVAMSVKSLIDWFMPVEINSSQPCLKLFARIGIGITKTRPTVTFRPEELIRTDDAHADSPGPRVLNIHCSDLKKGGIELSSSKDGAPNGSSEQDKKASYKTESLVMNDGCARISKDAAKSVAESLGLDIQIPSVYQGRIGGAKGVWMIDPRDETVSPRRDGRDYWIEITDSQLKFEGHREDTQNPDPTRVTFEVHSFSGPLVSTTLNFQLIPILVHGGVPDKVFKDMLIEEINFEAGTLGEAMKESTLLRKWNQVNNSTSRERAQNGGIKMIAGLPDSRAERINWFVERGFDPKSCRHVKDLCYEAFADHCERLETRMKIGIGRSTNALMIADPLDVLQEDEVHLGFSSVFRDERSGFQDTMLDDMYVLVARLPALLPSDIQKVRAVFKKELRVYRDVIVFSSRGTRSLADKLSGGDYDGDRAWLCWDPAIVDPYQNANDVHSTKPLEYYGIVKDRTRTSDLFSQKDYIENLILKGVDFNMQRNLLSKCTLYHEASCYHGQSIDKPIMKDIAALNGLLVDSAKGGLTFTKSAWLAFLTGHGLPSERTPPAWRDQDHQRPTSHIIDELVLRIAKGTRERVLGDLSQRYASVPAWDDDVAREWKSAFEESKLEPALRKILDALKEQLRDIREYWTSHNSVDNTGPRQRQTLTFRALAEECRERFLAIEPLHESNYCLAKRWSKECEGRREGWPGSWLALKASALFAEYHQKGMFPWLVAGKELGALKAGAIDDNPQIIVERLYQYYKVDTKLMGKRKEDDDEVLWGEQGLNEMLDDFDEADLDD